MGTFAKSEDQDEMLLIPHFIRVCTVGQDKNIHQELKYTLIWKF